MKKLIKKVSQQALVGWENFTYKHLKETFDLMGVFLGSVSLSGFALLLTLSDLLGSSS